MKNFGRNWLITAIAAGMIAKGAVWAEVKKNSWKFEWEKYKTQNEQLVGLLSQVDMSEIFNAEDFQKGLQANLQGDTLTKGKFIPEETRAYLEERLEKKVNVNDSTLKILDMKVWSINKKEGQTEQDIYILSEFKNIGEKNKEWKHLLKDLRIHLTYKSIRKGNTWYGYVDDISFSSPKKKLKSIEVTPDKKALIINGLVQFSLEWCSDNPEALKDIKLVFDHEATVRNIKNMIAKVLIVEKYKEALLDKNEFPKSMKDIYVAKDFKDGFVAVKEVRQKDPKKLDIFERDLIMQGMESWTFCILDTCGFKFNKNGRNGPYISPNIPKEGEIIEFKILWDTLKVKKIFKEGKYYHLISKKSLKQFRDSLITKFEKDWKNVDQLQSTDSRYTLLKKIDRLVNSVNMSFVDPTILGLDFVSGVGVSLTEKGERNFYIGGTGKLTDRYGREMEGELGIDEEGNRTITWGEKLTITEHNDGMETKPYTLLDIGGNMWDLFDLDSTLVAYEGDHLHFRDRETGNFIAKLPVSVVDQDSDENKKSESGYFLDETKLSENKVTAENFLYLLDEPRSDGPSIMQQAEDVGVPRVVIQDKFKKLYEEYFNLAKYKPLLDNVIPVNGIAAEVISSNEGKVIVINKEFAAVGDILSFMEEVIKAMEVVDQVQVKIRVGKHERDFVLSYSGKDGGSEWDVTWGIYGCTIEHLVNWESLAMGKEFFDGDLNTFEPGFIYKKGKIYWDKRQIVGIGPTKYKIDFEKCSGRLWQKDNEIRLIPIKQTTSGISGKSWGGKVLKSTKDK